MLFLVLCIIVASIVCSVSVFGHYFDVQSPKCPY